ncbi:MAG: hypothetical protein Q8N14_06165 [Candidatus Omnitrophota bacterium]|nr:hypothetical protein [Candidatus Omnitrophota bacterium]
MTKIENCPRLIFSIIYFILSVSIIIFYRDKIFYLYPTETFNLFRFLWCIACSLLGFSFLALVLALTRPNPGPYIPTIPSYITYYPIMLILISCLIFSIFNAIEVTRGYIFYYASGAICCILGYQVDMFWLIIGRFIAKQADKG